MKLLSFVAFLTILLLGKPCTAQWTQTAGPSAAYTYSLAAIDSTLYAGTDEGIFESGDQGAVWTNSGMVGYTIRSLLVFGTNLFAGTDDGLYCSTDSGESWKPRSTGIQFEINYFVGGLVRIGTNLFAFENGVGIFRSTDSGFSWSGVDSGLGDPYVYSLGVQGNTLLAGTRYGLYRSDDSANSWYSADSGILSVSNIKAFAVLGAMTFAGDDNGEIYRSTNTGKNWTPILPLSSLLSGGVLSILTVGTDIFVATGGSGTYFSNDSGNSWSFAGLDSDVNIYTLLDDSGVIYAGTEGQGVYRRSLSDFDKLDVNAGSKERSFGIYPDPVADKLNVFFTLERPEAVTVSILNLLGEKVAEVFEGILPAGSHLLTQPITGLASGMYECILETSGSLKSFPIYLR